MMEHSYIACLGVGGLLAELLAAALVHFAAILPSCLGYAVPSNAGKLAEPAATDSASAKGKAPTFSALSHLTGQSARFGRWEVVIFNPTARTRE